MPFLWEKLQRKKILQGEIPRHIAIIMDGNGTWAQRRGLPRTAGHAKGADALRRTITECAALGVKYLSVYAFSTENWKRPKPEVNYLMKLFMQALQKEVDELQKNKIQIKFLGELNAFDKKLQNLMQAAEKQTARPAPLMTLNVLINYGSRNEILQAVKNIQKKKIKITNEADFSKHLYTAGVPDPDLMIRTSGQQRISNFLLWQCAYAEFYFTPVCWPDFSGKQLRLAIQEYQRRHRRLGGL